MGGDAKILGSWVGNQFCKKISRPLKLCKKLSRVCKNLSCPLCFLKKHYHLSHNHPPTTLFKMTCAKYILTRCKNNLIHHVWAYHSTLMLFTRGSTDELSVLLCLHVSDFCVLAARNGGRPGTSKKCACGTTLSCFQAVFCFKSFLTRMHHTPAHWAFQNNEPLCRLCFELMCSLIIDQKKDAMCHQTCLVPCPCLSSWIGQWLGVEPLKSNEYDLSKDSQGLLSLFVLLQHEGTLGALHGV